MGPAERQLFAPGMVGSGGIEKRRLANIESRRRLHKCHGSKRTPMNVERNPISMGVPSGRPDMHAVPPRAVRAALHGPIAGPDSLGRIDFLILDRFPALGGRVVQDVLAVHLASAWQVPH